MSGGYSVAHGASSSAVPSTLAPSMLLHQLQGDLIAAFVAACSVSPTVTMMDRAITKSAAGVQGLWTALGDGLKELCTKPLSSFRSLPTRWLILVYSATYFGANAALTLSDHNGISPVLPVLLGSTAGNMTTGIAKDRAFARMYGVSSPRPFPTASYALFLTRDLMAMAFVFNLPDFISPCIREHSGLSERRATLACQLATPVISQVFSTPFHLLGLLVYNNQDLPLGKSLTELRSQYPSVVSLRMLRIIPAFSCGGVVNRQIREDWRRAEG